MYWEGEKHRSKSDLRTVARGSGTIAARPGVPELPKALDASQAGASTINGSFPVFELSNRSTVEQTLVSGSCQNTDREAFLFQATSYSASVHPSIAPVWLYHS